MIPQHIIASYKLKLLRHKYRRLHFEIPQLWRFSNFIILRFVVWVFLFSVFYFSYSSSSLTIFEFFFLAFDVVVVIVTFWSL